jgi:hypothetical protein
MREARQGRCARQGREDAIGKAGNIREATQGTCARQELADSLGK